MIVHQIIFSFIFQSLCSFCVIHFIGGTTLSEESPHLNHKRREGLGGKGSRDLPGVCV